MSFVPVERTTNFSSVLSATYRTWEEVAGEEEKGKSSLYVSSAAFIEMLTRVLIVEVSSFNAPQLQLI